MNRIFTVLVGILCSLTLVGCGSVGIIELPSGEKIITTDDTEEVVEQVQQEQEPMTWSAKEVQTIQEDAGTTDVIDRSLNPFGIHPGKVYIHKLQPARIVDTWQADDEYGFYKDGDPTGIVVFNNLYEPMQFLITLSLDFEAKDGYVKPPSYVRDWIHIQDTSPVLQLREVKLIPIALVIPKDAEVFALKWEFRIVVKMEQRADVEFANEQRWLVEMKPQE